MGFVQKEVLNLNKKYELALILKPDLSEEAFNAEMDNIKNMLDKSGAITEKIDCWGKKKLAYQIKKFSEGNYNFIIFSGEPNLPIDLESKLRINENIIRFLIVKHEN